MRLPGTILCGGGGGGGEEPIPRCGIGDGDLEGPREFEPIFHKTVEGGFVGSYTSSCNGAGGFETLFGEVEIGEGAFLYPENGLRMFDFCFCDWFCWSPGIGLVARLVGWKLSSRTMTKFEGKRPIMRLSRLSLPIHHDPSPALRHSIRSPSTKPRSRSVSPPHEYTARHQHGNCVGRSGIVFAISTLSDSGRV